MGGYHNDQISRLDLVHESWHHYAPTPARRFFHASGVIGRDVLVAGGYAGGALDSCLIFNLDKNSWREAASLPQPRNSHALEVVQHNAYAYGGEEQMPSGAVWRYDAVLDLWTDCPSMLAARFRHASASDEYTMYAIGGERRDTGECNLVERWDIRCAEWQWLEEFPARVAGMRAAMLGESIYVCGGQSSEKEYQAGLHIFDTRAARWRQGAPMPVPLYHGACVATAGRIFYLGGENTDGDSDRILVYSPVEDKWRDGPRFSIGTLSCLSCIVAPLGHPGQVTVRTRSTSPDLS
eukprot:TRINITY_DN3864_c0_g1_i1.p1 TRINITY_DN3864_c0_g1~~TRINITY_DN3864_c0_g1_i1.p1  ORF type:complete len:294 (-),score=50.59 TRINITY_DN3864_c0_g1_i1:96-977(-)